MSTAVAALDIPRPLASSRRNSRLSISELGSSADAPRSYLAELAEMERSPGVTSRLSILASPKSPSIELPQEIAQPPRPARRHSFRLGTGPASYDAAHKSPKPSSQLHSPMPHQPTRVYSEDEVYEEIRKYEQEGYQDDQESVTVKSGSGPVRNNTGVVELSDDILLPFADRKEVKDILFNSQHKPIVDILKSDSLMWNKVLKVLDIPRDIMGDEHWITELKSIIYPKGESLWHRIVMAIGIDAQDAAVTPWFEQNTVMWVEPVHDGDSLLESEKANVQRRSQDTTPTMSSPSMPFSMELPTLPSTQSPRSSEVRLARKHERVGSGGSLRNGGAFKGSMTSIAEDIGSSSGGFPEPTQPPKKLNFELLAEQDRQMALFQSQLPPSWHIGSGSQAPSHASHIPPSIEADEEEEADHRGAFKRSQSGRSIHSGAESPVRRMRGLRFVTCPTGESPTMGSPHSPSASFRRDLLGKSVGSASDGFAIETDSEEDPRPASLSRSSSLGLVGANHAPKSKLRFNFGQQRGGPAILA